MHLHFEPQLNTTTQELPAVGICAPHVSHAPANPQVETQRGFAKKPKTTNNRNAVFHCDEKNFSFESASLVTLSSSRVARHATKKQVSLPLAGTQTWTPKRSQGLQAPSRQVLKVAVKRSRDSRTRQHPSNVMPHTVVA